MGEEVTFYNNLDEIKFKFKFRTIFIAQLLEIAEIRNPSSTKNEQTKIVEDLKKSIKQVYVYYPWHNLVLETVPEQEFFEIKTNRNQLLITKDEQHTLYNNSISIAGMSVGSSLLYGLVGSGFGKRFSIADDDTFSTSNLNRVQATVLDIGEPKVLVAKKRALEMNPFLIIKAFNQRLVEQDVSAFLFDGASRIVFEEIDDFRMKVVIREEAKDAGIPLIMLTNLADSVMIDVERYDSEKNTEPFNGLVQKSVLESIKNSDIDTEMMKKLAVQLVDRSLITDRAINSLHQIGESLVGRPQLYGTVALDGGIAPYLFRRIVNENNLKSGRYSLIMEGIA